MLAAGAVALLAAPAFAADVTIEKKETTVTKQVPESGSTVSTTIIAPTAPPSAQVETPPPPPAPTAVWVPGHWLWNPERQTFIWGHGKFLEPPHAHAAWVPGTWLQTPTGWAWHEGHWD